MSAIIYRLTNTINQKTYIGLTTKTLDERWRKHIGAAHCGSSYHLHRAIRKYGEDAFTREVLEETTTDLMNGRERYWIAECSPEYNMTSGGEGVLGLSHTPETRAKLSVASRNMSPEHRAKISAAQTGEKHHMYGKTRSPETRAKIGAANRGKTRSPETRAKLSVAHRGKTPSPETRAKLSAAQRGKTLSPETRAKLSAAHTGDRNHNYGKPLSPETRAKLSAAQRGRTFSPEHRAKLSAAARKRYSNQKSVICGSVVHPT